MRVRNETIAIIDIFEELLEKHNITIPDDGRMGDEGEARIFGDAYYELEEKIDNFLDDLEIKYCEGLG